MARFRHLVFVCTNERAADDPRGSCKQRGARELLSRLKELGHAHGLKRQVRVTSSGCLDLCAKGCAAVAFSSEGAARETWYTQLTAQDADRLFESHILRGEPLADKVESRDGVAQAEAISDSTNPKQ